MAGYTAGVALLMCWVLAARATENNQTSNLTVTGFLSSALDPLVYDARVRPGADSGEPTLVRVSLKINSISSVQEIHMDYTVNIYLRQEWKDPRLSHQHFHQDIALSHSLMTSLWVPDVFFSNEKEGTFHDVTVPNRLLRVSPDGTILYSQRISARLSCEMDLLKYPVDNQTCYIKMESYGYTTKDLVLYWNNLTDPIEEGIIELPEFDISNITSGDCTAVYATGSFTCIYVSLGMQRQFSYYLIQIYLPSLLIVILSWVSFWIDRNSVPARISLGLLTVLTITTQSSGINTRMPKVSYIKAIDVWMATCLVFVFGAFVEYSIVNTLSRAPKEDSKSDNKSIKSWTMVDNDKEIVTSFKPSPEDMAGETKTPEKSQSNCRPEVEDRATLVDVLARFLFPAAFVLFNVIYWVTYKHILV